MGGLEVGSVRNATTGKSEAHEARHNDLKEPVLSEPTILFVKPKAISDNAKGRLFKAGVIVVEIADPADAKFVRAGVELSSSEMLRCAAEAIMKGGSGQTQIEFAKALCAAIQK